MEFKGKVTFIGGADVISEKLTKRIFVIEIQNGQYKDDLAFELINNKVDLVDGVNVGDTVTVGANISSREWNGKWFTQASAWKIDAMSPAGTPAPVKAKADLGDDLPF
jgi:single-strand DNA-binding protein